MEAFTPELISKINSSKVLVVGAGGIGCELLKNLVLTGFRNIEVIDLDTIDVSNLNRQFLFHKEHVGRSKAEVARESCLEFNPNANIVAHHGSIMSAKFGLNYFNEFNLVLNALDNRAARAHVNRLCLAANVPLIDSGTSGYTGQVELIYKGLTRCYDCEARKEAKTYPACTIRTTPTEHIHCTIWAKYLFNQLFGEPPQSEDQEVVSSGKGDGGPGASTIRDWAQKKGYDPELVFNKLFHDDIQEALKMADLWKTRTPPKPLSWDSVVKDLPPGDDSHLIRDQKMWSMAECRDKFAESLKSLKSDMGKLGDGENLVWDKDDDPAMDFVAATANIRAHVYNIPTKTRFEIKAMAGNIIPAIATSNAVVAGLIVLHAMKVLQGRLDECKTVWLRQSVGPQNGFIVPEKVFDQRNPNCFVCSSKQILLTTDLTKFTCQDLDKAVLRGYLSMIEPEVFCNGALIISSEEGETDHLAQKTLTDLNVNAGAILMVEDYVQNYQIKIMVHHKEMNEEETGEKFTIEGCLDLNKKLLEDTPKETNGSISPQPTSSRVNDDDDLVICEEATATKEDETGPRPTSSRNDDDDDDVIFCDDEANAPSKRPNSADSPGVKTPKKRKTEDSNKIQL